MIVNLTNEKGIKLLTKDKLCKEDITIIPDLPGVGEDLADVLDAQEELIETLRTTLEGKAAGGGGGGMQGFHMVRFFNDDRTTLLYTVYVADGSSAIYAGDTPISTEDAGVFAGFEPSSTNVTADMDCYAVYNAVTSLEEATWEQISMLSESGAAQNYFAVGDTKKILVKGTVGTLSVNTNLYVYIIGFDHNRELEGTGIHFGTFKNASGVDVALVDSKYAAYGTNGSKHFTLLHWGGTLGNGWKGCDLRYDVLGSTDKAPSGYGATADSNRVGYDASETCATKPVDGTLMAALPADLRAVMKPMTKYSTNVEGGKNASSVTSSIDYLPLLGIFEMTTSASEVNTYEKNKQARYEYFTAGGSTKKYKYSDTAANAICWTRSVRAGYPSDGLGYSNQVTTLGANKVYAIAPIFKV